MADMIVQFRNYCRAFQRIGTSSAPTGSRNVLVTATPTRIAPPLMSRGLLRMTKGRVFGLRPRTSGALTHTIDPCRSLDASAKGDYLPERTVPALGADVDGRRPLLGAAAWRARAADFGAGVCSSQKEAGVACASA